MKISLQRYLQKFDNLYVNLKSDFKEKLRGKIISNSGSLTKLNKKYFKIHQSTFLWYFKDNNGIKINILNKICSVIGLNYETNILSYYLWGSHRKYFTLPEEIYINPNCIERVGVYVAEGDTRFPVKTNLENLD